MNHCDVESGAPYLSRIGSNVRRYAVGRRASISWSAVLREFAPTSIRISVVPGGTTSVPLLRSRATAIVALITRSGDASSSTG